MKYAFYLILACALVAVALAETHQNSHKERKANNNGPAVKKNEHHERSAHAPKKSEAANKSHIRAAGPKKAPAPSPKQAPAPSPKQAPAHSPKKADDFDLEKAFKQAVDSLTPLAKDGSSLALDAVKSFLGDKNARKAPANLQKRAAKLATDSFSAIQELTPTVAKLVQAYAPKAIEAASAGLSFLGL